MLLDDWGAIQGQLTELTLDHSPQEAAESLQLWTRAHDKLARTLRGVASVCTLR